MRGDLSHGGSRGSRGPLSWPTRASFAFALAAVTFTSSSLCGQEPISLVLETGHSSPEESLILIRAARAADVTRIVVTHAMADPIGMSTEQMKEAARLGAKIECVWMTNLNGPRAHLESMRHWRKVTTADYAEAMRKVGPEHFILASDLGQYLNPLPTDGMKAFILDLRKHGLTKGEIDRMCRRNPAALLGITAAKTKKQ